MKTLQLRNLASAVLLAGFVLGSGIGPAVAKTGATGTITLDGKTWNVVDAVAVSDQGSVEIWFSELPFDRVKWAEDGQFDVFDPYHLKDAPSGTAVTVDVDEEGTYGGHSVRHGSSSSSSSMSSDLEDTLVLSANDETRVAGRWKLDDGAGLVTDVQFDLPITKTGPMARPGTPLPAGGGDPGKALRAMVDATHAGNLDAMIALSPPAQRKEIEQAKAAGEADEVLKMAKLFTPKITKVTGGSVVDDQAWVDFEGTEASGAVKGSAELSRIDGKWYLKSINTKSGS